jgi:hypothetical protein
MQVTRSARVSAATAPIAALALVVLAATCMIPSGGDKGGSDSSSAGPPVNGTGDSANWAISVQVSRDSLPIMVGQSDTLSFRVTRSGGFTGTVLFNISVSGGPGLGTYQTNVLDTATANNVTTGIVSVALTNNAAPVTFTAYLLSFRAPPGTPPDSTAFKVTVLQKPGIFVTVSSNLSVPQGFQTTTSVDITRTQSTDPASLTLINAPPGLTATFSPNPITPDITHSTMTLVADASLAESTYTGLGVRVNAGLPTQATAPINVTVTGPASLALALSPDTLTIARGAQGTTTLNITRTNFTKPIGINFNAPPGVSASTTSPVATSQATVTVGVGAGTASGAYTVTVFTSSSEPPATTTFVVIVP